METFLCVQTLWTSRISSRRRIRCVIDRCVIDGCFIDKFVACAEDICAMDSCVTY